MKKYTKQRLFEMMQRVNPDFIVNENDNPEYTGDELHLLYVLVWNLMNAHILHNPQTTEKFIYDYNQKHGNVIKFPLINRTRDEVTKGIADFIYGENKATDEILMNLAKMDSNQLTQMLNQHFEKMKKEIEQHFEKYKDRSNFGELIDNVLRERKSSLDWLIHDLYKSEKYKNFPSSKDNLYSNFYEMFPVARPTWDGSLDGEKAINAAKSLVAKGDIQVIPFTEQEQTEMNEKLTSPTDYLTPNWGYSKNGYAHVILVNDDHNKITQQYQDYVKNNFKFTKENLSDVLSTAMEGGSNYWALFDLRAMPVKLRNDNNTPLSERITTAVWDYHASIPVYDKDSAEDEPDSEIDSIIYPHDYDEVDTINTTSYAPDEYNNLDRLKFEKLGVLSMDSILDAISILKKNPQYEQIFSNIANENYDAGDADVFLQLAIMGKVVYG